MNMIKKIVYPIILSGFLVSVSSSFAVPVEQSKQEKKRELPSLEECVNKNLEFLTGINKFLIKEPFWFGFEDKGIRYDLNQYGNRTKLEVELNEEKFGIVKYFIYCKGGLFNQVNGLKVKNPDLGSERQLLARYLIGEEVIETLWFSDKIMSFENSEPFKLEMQKLLYDCLLKMQNKIGSKKNIFFPKVMPEEYFNKLSDKTGILIKIIDKYGTLDSGEDKFNRECFDTRKYLDFEFDDKKYRVILEHPFYKKSSFLQTNESLREKTKIKIQVNKDCPLTFIREKDPHYTSFIDLDPLKGKIKKGSILNWIMSESSNSKEFINETFLSREQAFEVTAEHLKPGALDDEPSKLRQLREAIEEVKVVKEYLIKKL